MSSRSTSRAASVPAKSSSRGKPSAHSKPSEPTQPPKLPGRLSGPAPKWTGLALALLAAFLLLSVFTTESGDTDTWWHLKTGQYIVQEHKLPVPDPFQWTTYMGKPSYPGEGTTRDFNLTHEWLSQIMLYGAFAAGGFTGLILLRALWLTAFCSLVGAIAYRRTGSYVRALGAGFGTVMVVRHFIADRPQFVTYAFLALTILILESRKRLWLLPPLFLIWANCHAGFIMGWVIMGSYCAESVFLRLRGKPMANDRRLWIMCVGAVLISGLNPNFYKVVEVLGYYRQSQLQSSIWEWQRPKYWETSPFTILMYGSAALLLLNWRKTRPVDWMLFGVFAVSGLMAMRNIFLIGMWGPILFATYLPRWEDRKSWAPWVLALALAAVTLWHLQYYFFPLTLVLIAAAWSLAATRRYPIVVAGIIAFLLARGVLYQIVSKDGFQFRGAMWRYPEAACDFLIQHHIKGRMLNIYGQGGYLIWRLWPQLQVFQDGRALNEKVYQDSNRITMNMDADPNGKSALELLKDYGIDIIMMDGFEFNSGTAYYLPAALADPNYQKDWKLVFQDLHEVIYMRNPPPDVTPLKSLDALVAMEEQCQFNVDNGSPNCARGMVDIFGKIGDRPRYDKWRQVYQANHTAGDWYTVVKK